MTIRAKLYVAILLTVIGPVITIAVALHGMDRLGDRFDEVQERADQRALALDLKFGVTDFNGWQTAYGYDDGASRGRFTRSVRRFRADFATARKELTDPREVRLLREIGVRFDRFMELDDVAYAALQRGNNAAVKRIFLGPELRLFDEMALRSEGLASYEARGAEATETGVQRFPRGSRRAADRGRAGRRARDRAAAGDGSGHRAPGDRGPPSAPVTDDIFLTLSLLLMGALMARFIASLLGIPEILVLVVVGAIFGSSVLDVIDVPFDSLGAQLIFTLGVSLILFYGGLVAVSADPARGMDVAPDARGAGRRADGGVVGVTAPLRVRPSWDMALLVGAVLSPTDPAILIPLFGRSRLRPKVAETVIAESAFNDPTGAVLALTFAGVVLSGSTRSQGRPATSS